MPPLPPPLLPPGQDHCQSRGSRLTHPETQCQSSNVISAVSANALTSSVAMSSPPVIEPITRPSSVKLSESIESNERGREGEGGKVNYYAPRFPPGMALG